MLNMMVSQEEQNYRNDPLISHTFSKEEFVLELSRKIKESQIGERIQLIVSGKLRIFEKVSDQKVKEVES